MAKPRKLTEKRGWAFATAVIILKPILLAITRRRWLDGEKIPAEGGCILVANHVSHLDPLTFAHMVYDYGRIPRFLAKREVFDAPVAGTIVKNAGQIPVSRLSTDASQAFQAAVDAVRRGECVVVYPEGTISREPNLWPMRGKTGAARIALTADVPVIPIAQWGANDILAPYSKNPKVFPRRTVTMQVGDPVDLGDLRGKPLTPAVLREATERIMASLTILLEGIRGSTAPSVRFDPKVAGIREIGNPNARHRHQQRRTGERS